MDGGDDDGGGDDNDGGDADGDGDTDAFATSGTEETLKSDVVSLGSPEANLMLIAVLLLVPFAVLHYLDHREKHWKVGFESQIPRGKFNGLFQTMLKTTTVRWRSGWLPDRC